MKNADWSRESVVAWEASTQSKRRLKYNSTVLQSSQQRQIHNFITMSSYPGQLYDGSGRLSQTSHPLPPYTERTYKAGHQQSPTHHINNQSPPYPTTPPERIRDRGHGQSHYFERAPPPPPKQVQQFGPNTRYPQYSHSHRSRKVI